MCVRACVRACVCVCVRACAPARVSAACVRANARRRLSTDGDQIWHTHSDSSRKGSGPNTHWPHVTQGVLGGGG